jgi:N-acetyl-anhydromuramyl-L-alanine amidase AmpD
VQPDEVYRLALGAGLDSDSAVIATAIAWAESGLGPDAVGDEDLEDEKWGPSCGLWQIRSLRAHSGTGMERDRERLFDPAFNARAMATISAGGTTWTPWSVFKNGRYRQHLDDVVGAIEEVPMPTVSQPWMPAVQHVDRGGGTPVQWDGPTVVVLHTTETDRRASYSGTEPHFEVDRDGSILQYVSLNRTAKALYNAPGGGETNRRRGRIIQIEMVNRAGRIADITDAQLDGVAECLRFVDTQLPFDKVEPPQGWFGSEAAWDGADSRFTREEWEAFGGICGHQHVIENDHWDPGVFPFQRLRSRLGGTPSKEDQLFSPSPVYTVHLVASHSGLLLTSSAAEHGAGVIQRRADGSLNQRWEVWGHDDGTVSFVNRAGGFALDRPDYSTEAGTLLQVARTEHNAAQRWAVDEVEQYLARIWAPGTNRLIDMRMRSKDEGAGAQLWYGLKDEEDPRHQRFVFVPTI